MSKLDLVWAKRLAITVALASLALAGCKGEDRPNVEVLGGAGSVSVSASDLGPSESGGQGASSPSAGTSTYRPVTNVDRYFNMGLDLRDMNAALAATPPDFAKAREVYEQGKNQVAAAGGAARALTTQPNDAVQAVFPNGASVYGRPSFIDAIVKDGLAGTGRAAGLSDASRKEIIEKGTMMLFYGVALQEFTAAKTRLETGAANPAGPVDETFSTLAGAAEGTNRPYSIFAVGLQREKDFKLDGKLVAPLETSLAAALAAAQKNDKDAFNKAYTDGKGYMNSIFYLSALRYAQALETDSTPAARQTHLAEGWAFWQTIRAAAASGSSKAAQDVESAFTKDPSGTWAAADTTKVYAALNESAVLQALGIPAVLQIKTPPKQ